MMPGLSFEPNDLGDLRDWRVEVPQKQLKEILVGLWEGKTFRCPENKMLKRDVYRR